MCVFSSSAGRAVGFPWRRGGSLMHVIYILLFQAAGEAGDGYRARRSPHTPHERFEGLTVLKAMQVKWICESAAFLIVRRFCHPSIFFCELHSGWCHGCAVSLTTCVVSSDLLPPQSHSGMLSMEGLTSAFSPARDCLFL